MAWEGGGQPCVAVLGNGQVGVGSLAPPALAAAQGYSLPLLFLQGVCTMTAAFLHFFFLSSFCWVLTEAWQSYLAVIGRMRTRLVRKRFLCLGWGERARAGLCSGPGWGVGVGRGNRHGPVFWTLGSAGRVSMTWQLSHYGSLFPGLPPRSACPGGGRVRRLYPHQRIRYIQLVRGPPVAGVASVHLAGGPRSLGLTTWPVPLGNFGQISSPSLAQLPC